MQWTGISSVYVSAVQFVQLFILAFFLSPSEIGTMTILLLLVWFSQALADGGMSPALIHKQQASPRVLNTLFALNVIYSVILFVLLWLFRGIIAVVFDQPDLTAYIPYAASVVVIAAIGTQFRVILNKELRFDLVARHEMASITVNFLVAVALAWNGYGVWSMVIGYVCGSVISATVLIWYGSAYWKPGRGMYFGRELGEYVRFGVYQMGERVLIFLNSRVDQLLIGSLLGTQALGIYTLAHNFVVGPTIRVNQIISTVMFPVFARVQHDESLLRKGYLKLVKVVTVINTPILLGIAVTAPVLIPFLYDEAWFEAIYILQILSVYALIRSTGSPAGSLQLAKGRADLGFKWNFALLLITGPAIYTGYSIQGLTGIAYAQIILHVSLFVPYWIFMIRPLIGPPAKSYFFAIFDAFVPGIFMGATVWVIGWITQDFHDIFRLLLMTSSGMLLFILFVKKTEHDLFDEISTLIRNKYAPKS